MRAKRHVMSMLLLCLAACETTPPLDDGVRVKTSEEVGNVFVSAYPAVPWSDIAEKLEPKNNLSTTDARTMAAITTQAQVSQFLSTFAAGLAIGLPSTTSVRSTAVAADGSRTTTGTDARASGSKPESSGAAATAITDAALAADLSKSPLTLGIDGATQLTAGTALYQLGQILDNQISKSLPLKGYEAYLVTFQVNLQPLARNRPYDAYVNLTLMPGSWEKAVAVSQDVTKSADQLSPIIVFPLVISESMESSSVGRSIEVMRQAALSLSGIVGNVGINGSVSGGTDNLNALLGSDRNSLVTVGRVSDHTLRIRLGAQQQGSKLLALVPQTRNVSVVVFTRAGDMNPTYLDKLAVITETTFVDVATGVRVDSTRDSEPGRVGLGQQVDDALATFRFEFNPSCKKDGYSQLDLLRSLDRGDYKRPTECVVDLLAPIAASTPSTSTDTSISDGTSSTTKAPNTASSSTIKPATLDTILRYSAEVMRLATEAATQTGKTPADQNPAFAPALESRLRRLVARLMTIQTDSRFSKLMISLRSYQNPAPKLPGDQLLLVSDDKTATKMTLRGGLNLQRDELDAYIRIPRADDGAQASVLQALSVEVDSSGKSVTVVFPSLKANKILEDKAVGDSGALTKDYATKVYLWLAYTGKRTPTSCGDAATKVDPQVTVKCVDEKSDLCTSVKRVIAQDCRTAQYADLRFVMPPPDPTSNPVTTTAGVLIPDATGTAAVSVIVGEWDEKKNGKLVLRVGGADIKAVTPAAPIDPKARGINLTPMSVLVLTLSNLTSSQVVQLRTIANKEPVGNAIVLPVQYLTTASH